MIKQGKLGSLIDNRQYQCLIMPADYDSICGEFATDLYVSPRNTYVFPGANLLFAEAAYDEHALQFNDVDKDLTRRIQFAGDWWHLSYDDSLNDESLNVPTGSTHYSANSATEACDEDYDEYPPCRICGHVSDGRNNFWIFANDEHTPLFLEECERCLVWLLTDEDSPRFQQSKKHELRLFMKKLDDILTKKATEDPQTMKSFLETMLDRLERKVAINEQKLSIIAGNVAPPEVTLESFLAAVDEVKKTQEELKAYRNELHSLHEEYQQSIRTCNDLVHSSNRVLERNAELAKQSARR